jgi:hypothetical protein
MIDVALNTYQFNENTQYVIPAGIAGIHDLQGWQGSDVGRNKPVRALSAGLAFPAFRLPETPTLAVAGRSYSGLRRDAYNDERSAWERADLGCFNILNINVSLPRWLFESGSRPRRRVTFFCFAKRK